MRDYEEMTRLGELSFFIRRRLFNEYIKRVSQREPRIRLFLFSSSNAVELTKKKNMSFIIFNCIYKRFDLFLYLIATVYFMCII